MVMCTGCGNNNANNKNENNSTNTTKNSATNGNTALPDRKAFQQTIDGKQTDLFILKNRNGMTAAITDYGGPVVSLQVPDQTGKMVDVSIGYNDVQSYAAGGDTYFGALIGRYGNRIVKGRFILNGKQNNSLLSKSKVKRNNCCYKASW
ncbi:MAG: hypothetical protein ICV84_15215 [Flavisolibacter sp.]|nr:hypothetical protein [Flavisolibacter sp.]